MASPIVIDGSSSIIPINTATLVAPITVQLPPLDLGGKLFTIIDVGGKADINPITINCTGGAQFTNGQTTFIINIPSGSFSFSQISNSRYLLPQTMIRGNILTSRPQITLSSSHTVLSTIQNESSLVVYNDLAVKQLVLGGPVYALGGFQPSPTNPYASINFLSAITVSTQSIVVGSIPSGGDLNSSNLVASSIFISSALNTNSIDTGRTLFAVSTYIGGLLINGQRLYNSDSNIYLGSYQLNNDINFLVPAFNSSVKGLVSSLNVAPGLSSLSTTVGLTPIVLNPNPGFSTLSTANALAAGNIGGGDTSTMFRIVSSALSSTNAIAGLSSLSSIISYGLSSIAIPFSLSTLFSPVVQLGLSSVFEGTTVSTLINTLGAGLSSVNQNTGIDALTNTTRQQLSTTASSAYLSSVSSQFGFGFSTIDMRLYTSTLYGAASTSFCNLVTSATLSSLSTFLEPILFDVNSIPGLSSLSTTIGAGLSTIDIKEPISTLSTSIALGLSSLSIFSLELSSLSTTITRQLSTLADPGISSLLNDLSRGASTVFAGSGISSFSDYQSTSFFNMTASAGLSSLSTTFFLGVSAAILGIVPSSQVTFSSLTASSLQLLNSVANYGGLVVDGGVLRVNGHAITPPNNNFEQVSSMSTYSLFVGSTLTSFATIAPSSVYVDRNLTTSSISGLLATNQSTIVGTLSLQDAATVGRINEIRATAGGDLLINGSTLFYNENVGLSTLSTFLAPSLSSISTFAQTINAISTSLSTLGNQLPRICTLSTLYFLRYTPDNISAGVSTITANAISTLRVSTMAVQIFNLSTLFASSIQTSSLEAGVASSFLLSRVANSYFIVSSLSVGTALVSSFPIGIQVSSVSTQGLTFGTLATPALVANSFFASTVTVNTLYASTLFLRDRGASYTIQRPLEFSTFYPLFGCNSVLCYNSTSYSGVALDFTTFQRGLSTNQLNVSTIDKGIIFTSTITFTGKVQFDRLAVMQSTLTPYFYACEHGYGQNGNSAQYTGRLYRSIDGISWSQVTPSANCWLGRNSAGGVGTDFSATNFEGADSYRIAFNGEYLLAYATTNNNPATARTTNSASNNAVSYDGGFTWSNINRTSFNSAAIQIYIFWDGEKWFKYTSGSNNPPNETPTVISYDGSNWQHYLWSIADNAATRFIFLTSNSQGSGSFAKTAAYNGTTLIVNNGPNQFWGSVKGSIGFSDDLVNGRALNENALCGYVDDKQTTTFQDMWSDGYAWWIPNQSQNVAGTSGLARIYPWRSGTTGISNADGSTSDMRLRWCVGIGFTMGCNMTSSELGNAGGWFNGQMHVCGRASFSGSTSNNSSLNLLYSYDGINFFRSPSRKGSHGNVNFVTYGNGVWLFSCTGNSSGTASGNQANTGNSIFYSYDGLNWEPSTGGPQCTTYTTNLTFYGGGIGQILYMSNLRPSLDFNGVRIYNQPGGITWNNRATREQSIVAFQSSMMLHNTIAILGDWSVSSLVAGTNMRVGIETLNPSTTLEIGNINTITAERLYTSSMYIIPTSTFVMSTTMFNNSNLALSTFNFYVAGSTFMRNLAVNVPRPVVPLDISGATPIFRFGFNIPDNLNDEYETAISRYLASNYGSESGVVLGPSMLLNSTSFGVYYRGSSGTGTNYKRTYLGSNFFTGQHATECLDISGAIVKTVVSTTTTDLSGNQTIEFSTLLTDYTGYLLSSADEGYVSIPNPNLRLWGSNAINIIEAMPKTRITTRDKDPAVFGIVTNNGNVSYNLDGSYTLDSDTRWGNDLYGRVRVNSIGEGALWVTNINGSIENGDYLCSSEIAGHARKQDEDGMFNFTVAKATMNCDFDVNSSNYKCEPIEHNGQTYLRAFIGVTYHCG